MCGVCPGSPVCRSRRYRPMTVGHRLSQMMGALFICLSFSGSDSHFLYEYEGRTSCTEAMVLRNGVIVKSQKENATANQLSMRLE